MNSGLKVPLFLRPARRFALAGGEGFSRRDAYGKGEFPYFRCYFNPGFLKIKSLKLVSALIHLQF